jgi:hypothetical protein
MELPRMKTCKQCQHSFSLDAFYRAPANADGHQRTCKSCYNGARREKNLKRYHDKYSNTSKYRHKPKPSAQMSTNQYIGRRLRECRRRAKQMNIECTITSNELSIPDICPVLGIPLAIGTKQLTNASPSIDRIDNNKGYVKGNVAVISTLANRLKSNASVEQLRAILAYVERHTGT